MNRHEYSEYQSEHFSTYCTAWSRLKLTTETCFNYHHPPLPLTITTHHKVLSMASTSPWNAYIFLEWHLTYRIKSKLPKRKIPCPARRYQVIQGCIWLIFSYMAFDQRVKWYFTDLKAIFRWIRSLILYIKQNKHFSPRAPPP